MVGDEAIEKYRIADLDERIISEKEGLIVVNKPFDIPTSGRTLDDPDALQYWVSEYLGCTVWAVHQLDADTTGVNLFVTEKRLVKKYQRALADTSTIKTYYALVHGVPPWESIECDAPIGKIDKRSLGVVALGEGKSAHSTFKVLSTSAPFSLVEAKITTGRTHQIRIHLTHLGFPLVGDDWYGVQTARKHCRQALHAGSIVFGDESLPRLVAPLAEDLVALCEELGVYNQLSQQPTPSAFGTSPLAVEDDEIDCIL